MRCVVRYLHRLCVPAHNVTPIADFRPTLTDVLTGLCTALSGRPTESNLKPMLEASTAARPHEGAYWWFSVTTAACTVRSSQLSRTDYPSVSTHRDDIIWRH